MTTDTATASEPVPDPANVMASMDTAGARTRFVIADITTDEAWISMRDSGRSLPEWA